MMITAIPRRNFRMIKLTNVFFVAVISASPSNLGNLHAQTSLFYIEKALVIKV